MQPSKFNFNPFTANNNSKVRPLQSNLKPGSTSKSPRANPALISQSLEMNKKPLTLQKSNTALNKSNLMIDNLSKSVSQINLTNQSKAEPMKIQATKTGITAGNYFALAK